MVKKSIKIDPKSEEDLVKILLAFSDISIGDYTAHLETDRDDIIGTLYEGVNEFINVMREKDEKAKDYEEEMKKQLDKAKDQIRIIQEQRAAIQELSTPIIKIWDDVLTLPVIGIVDTTRSEDMMVTLLERIVEEQTKCVIIDITGVNVVDTKTADHFIRMVKAAKLLGSECFITGISPEIAQTFTTMGVDLTNIKTLRNLEQGLKEAIKIVGYKVIKKVQE